MDKITHIHLEGPLINAAGALIPEKPTGLGWYKNHWAFLFNKRLSKKVIQVAQKTGFTINKDHSQTIVALPNVKEYEIKKATQRFDVFAEEYKKLSKRVASVINRSINEESQIIRTITAGYDLKKMEPGYKGAIDHRIYGSSKQKQVLLRYRLARNI